MIRAYLCRHIVNDTGGLDNPILRAVDAMDPANKPRCSLTMVYPDGRKGVWRSAWCLVVARGRDAESFRAMDGVQMLPPVGYRDAIPEVHRTAIERKLTEAGFSAGTVKAVTIEAVMQGMVTELRGHGWRDSSQRFPEEWGNG